MSAGTGIAHSERNPSATEDVHFVQMWVLPDTAGVQPSYEQLDVNEALAGGGLIPIASGQGHPGAIGLHQRDAVLWGGRLAAGTTVELPVAAHVHLFVAVGRATLDDGPALDTGDAVRLVSAEGHSLTAGEGGAEVLVWATA